MLTGDHHVFELADGKKLGFAVYGDPKGRPVLFFHGIPGSRHQRNPDSTALLDLGICVYALDRPGIGLSSFQPGRKLVDWPKDVAQFCDGLGLDQFSVIGVSGGAPYALACAHHLPDRVLQVAVVSGLAPLAVPDNFRRLEPRMRRLFNSAKRAPAALSRYFSLLYKILGARLEFAFQHFVAHLPASDQTLLRQPTIATMFQHDVAEAFRAGSRGIVQDMQILCQPWGFALADIHLPVTLWHGTADTIVPLALAQYNAKQLPQQQFHAIKDGGHFIALAYSREIFSHL